jgi:hypothetical protein
MPAIVPHQYTVLPRLHACTSCHAKSIFILILSSCPDFFKIVIAFFFQLKFSTFHSLRYVYCRYHQSCLLVNDPNMTRERIHNIVKRDDNSVMSI